MSGRAPAGGGPGKPRTGREEDIRGSKDQSCSPGLFTRLTDFLPLWRDVGGGEKVFPFFLTKTRPPPVCFSLFVLNEQFLLSYRSCCSCSCWSTCQDFYLPAGAAPFVPPLFFLCAGQEENGGLASPFSLSLCNLEER